MSAPGGGGHASARNVCNLMFRVADHPVAKDIFGEWSHEVIVAGGPSPRSWTMTKGQSWTPKLRGEIRVAKTGGDGRDRSHVAGVWRDPATGEDYAIAVLGVDRKDPEFRYQSPSVEATSRTDDWQVALEALRSGHVWLDSGENQKSGMVTQRTDLYDITSLFADAVKTSPTYGNSGIFLSVCAEHVTLSAYGVAMTGSGFFTTGLIPDGLRPENEVIGTLWRGTRPFPVFVRSGSGSVGANGGTATFPAVVEGADNTVSGSIMWPRRAYRDHYDLLPGVPLQTVTHASGEEGD